MGIPAEAISHRKDKPIVKGAIQTNQSGIGSLLRLSARIGCDASLVQGSSGNTSVKLDGTLWIKASGKWLAYADQEEIFVPVALPDCLDCLAEGRPLPPHKGSSWTSGLRPSIETFMHAVLPQRYVAHVHSVNTIAWAVRRDAPVQLARKLSGLRWQWIPYVPSGRPLARAVQTASSIRPETDVFVLGNHGLVVCGEDCGVIESLLCEVERRLAVHPRRSRIKPGFLEHIRRLSNWRLPEVDELHFLGTDVISQRIMRGGVLYPCQAMFLGRTLPVITHCDGVSGVMRQIRELDESISFLIIEDGGVLINDEISAAEYAALNGFVQVLRRIEASALIRYLTDQEVNRVLSVDGRRYKVSPANNVRLSMAGS